MPNPPAPLMLRRSSLSPGINLPSAFLTHNHPASHSIPIPQLSYSDGVPPMTGSSAFGTPTYLQTPPTSADPSRTVLINPSSPSSSPMPKGFPHAADLLGGPSETSSSRRPTPAPSSIDDVDEITSPTPSEVSSSPTVERVTRVRERIAARRAEWAVTTEAHHRSHSRHIFDSEPVPEPSLAELSRLVDRGRIAPGSPLRLPNEYIPTPAGFSFGGNSIESPTYPFPGSVSIPPSRPTLRPAPNPAPLRLPAEYVPTPAGFSFGGNATGPPGYPSFESISIPQPRHDTPQHAQTQAAQQSLTGHSVLPSIPAPRSTAAPFLPIPRPANSTFGAFPQPPTTGMLNAPDESRSAARPRVPEWLDQNFQWTGILANEESIANALQAEMAQLGPQYSMPRHASVDQQTAFSPLVSMWNHTIQQTVDRRLAVEPQRDARMAAHLREGYSQARLAALDQGAARGMHATAQWAHDHAAEQDMRRLDAVAGPGGRGTWGEIPIDTGYAYPQPISRIEPPGAPPASSHPSLRHHNRFLGMEDPLHRPVFDPPPYRTLLSNMDWFDYGTVLEPELGMEAELLARAQSSPFDATTSSRHTLFRAGQTEDEMKSVVRMVARGVSRLPPRNRKAVAESVVSKLKWCDREIKEGEEDETICAVCHDDYENESCIAVTPCKHMYHNNCLNVWLDQPLISSCPMCRRDLAVLACVERMLGKGKEVAKALWMSV